MLIIPCPYCGPRDEAEFTYGGPARHSWPSADADACRKSFYHGINPRGPLQEIWFHSSGCENWITVTRDTASHAFVTEQDT